MSGLVLTEKLDGSVVAAAAIVSVLLGVLGKSMCAFLGFPIRDCGQLLPDGLHFDRYGVVRFVDLTTISTDDYIKLGRQVGPALLVQPTLTKISTRADYQAFVAALVGAIDSWQKSGNSGAQTAGPRRTYFYGSKAAR